MGTHTNIYLSQKNKSLYFKYCYPNDLWAIKNNDFEQKLQELYLKQKGEPAEFYDGHAFIDNDFPYDYYFEFDGENLFQIIETKEPYEFARIKLDSNYNDEVAAKLEIYFDPKISFDINPPKRKIVSNYKLSELTFIKIENENNN